MLRVGIIGAGWWAANTHAPQLKATGAVEIVAACRRDPVRLKEFSEKVGVPHTFTDYEEMLDKSTLDAVVVCSPHSLHYPHVKAALERGLPVLSDKPLAKKLCDDSAQRLLALVKLDRVKVAGILPGRILHAITPAGLRSPRGQIDG